MTLDISVVIPTYNQNPEYLTEAIESALHQTYPKEKYEILVVDDGSTRIQPDAVVSRFKNDNVRLVKKEHGGIAHTLNTGVRMMNGRYLKWLSSDDALCEKALETLMGKAREGTIVYGDWFRMDECSHVLTLHHEPLFRDRAQMKKFIWQRFFANGTTTLIPRSAFQKVGFFDESLPYLEDYDWWLRAIVLYDYLFVHLDEVIAKYRMHTGQTTTRVVKKSLLMWRLKRRVYLMSDKSSCFEPVPNPSITSLIEQMFFEEMSRLYRSVFSRPPLPMLKKIKRTFSE